MEWYEWVIPLGIGVLLSIASIIKYRCDIRAFCRKNGLNFKEFKKKLKYMGWW